MDVDSIYETWDLELTNEWKDQLDLLYKKEGELEIMLEKLPRLIELAWINYNSV